MSTNAPYTRVFEDLELAGGTPSLHELRYPYRGTLRHLTAVITNGDGGSGTGGTLALYSQPVDPSSPNPLYLIKSFTLAANSYDSGELSIDYKNTEGDVCNHVRKLYAVISATGTGDKTISLAITQEPPSF